MIPTMLAIAALSTAPTADAAQEREEAVLWDWTQPHRYAIETSIRLPELIWIGSRYNQQARVDSLQIRLLAQCMPGTRERRKVWEVNCILEEVGFSAEAYPSEVGVVQQIVTDIDERLTGARIQLQMREDGRVVNIDLEDLERRNRRFAWVNENLRLLLSRAFAGLDLPLPGKGEADGWLQHQSWIMRAPAQQGSYGTSEITHKVTDVDATSFTITSTGRGMIVPGEGINKFDSRLVSSATFDPKNGRLLDRTWSLVGGPTASSLIAQGLEGYPYVVEGRLLALSEGQSWDVGESRELRQQEQGKSAIQQSTMGVPLQR